MTLYYCEGKSRTTTEYLLGFHCGAFPSRHTKIADPQNIVLYYTTYSLKFVHIISFYPTVLNLFNSSFLLCKRNDFVVNPISITTEPLVTDSKNHWVETDDVRRSKRVRRRLQFLSGIYGLTRYYTLTYTCWSFLVLHLIVKHRVINAGMIAYCVTYIVKINMQSAVIRFASI